MGIFRQALSETLDTTEKIRGVPGGLAMGTNLISFDKDSFTSYGLEQAQNAAISAEAELMFRSALNRLIADGLRISRYRPPPLDPRVGADRCLRAD